MHTPRIGLGATLAFAAGLVFAGCASDGSDGGNAAGAAPQAAAVSIKTFAYGPNPLQVKAGTAVTWTNTDDIAHTVTSGTREAADGGFDLALQTKGTTVSRTFDKAGTHAYHCSIHPGMDAVVNVS
ncbi:MAG: hypothetical protein AVDCRST_MAG50-2386 [uncultured Acidimicrobiales bacterium]|uniref:Blue (type 1) copper domain-containing protein n=1 Tax=uncultured Acidimicrobiales bacterium TaxID=310071 RepID=A0A6J4III6_9ACTN|nr:MAG: hypothetical protein AVDCRST_MAG50-2386 [uncultured Acidimicrobiales bacterium]